MSFTRPGLALKVREHVIRMTRGGGCFLGASLSCADLLVHLYTKVLRVLRHRREVAARLTGFDHVVVSGGGQLDEFWGGAFGHPYTLYRFAGAARRAGARLDILSVGTGTLATRLGRRFVRRALEAASYRSFRDARSRELAGPAGAAAGDPIVPDLAYGLPVAWLEPAPRARAGSASRRCATPTPGCGRSRTPRATRTTWPRWPRSPCARCATATRSRCSAPTGPTPRRLAALLRERGRPRMP
jgi:hypothetical protein